MVALAVVYAANRHAVRFGAAFFHVAGFLAPPLELLSREGKFYFPGPGTIPESVEYIRDRVSLSQQPAPALPALPQPAAGVVHRPGVPAPPCRASCRVFLHWVNSCAPLPRRGAGVVFPMRLGVSYTRNFACNSATRPGSSLPAVFKTGANHELDPLVRFSTLIV